MTAQSIAARIRLLVQQDGEDPNNMTECFAKACIILAEVAPHLSTAYMRGLVNGVSSPAARSSRHDIDQ